MIFRRVQVKASCFQSCFDLYSLMNHAKMILRLGGNFSLDSKELNFMSTTETQVNSTAPATAETANEFVCFQAVEVTAAEKWPALTDPAVHGLVVNAAKLAEILKSVNASEKIVAEMGAALTGRPAGFL